MSFSAIILLVLFLVVFVAVPVVLAQSGRRRPAGLANLRVCPDCGAHNYKAKERCYCCGYQFAHPQADEIKPAPIDGAAQRR
jgi:predicted amidophosphoribosyltransferase